MATILVTDGEQRSALAAVRSLGRAGHTVYVAAGRRRSLAGASRYVRRSAAVPDPLERPSEYTAEVRQRVIDWGVDLLLPVTEASLLALLPERAAIPAILPFPGADDFSRICDKGIVAQEAARLGVEVPRTVRVDAGGEATAAVLRGISPPAILKPARSVAVGNGRRVKQGVMQIPEGASLEQAIQSLPAAAFPLLVQERIEGPGVGVFVVLYDGELRAAFAHRRLREKPPWGGVSVYRESIPLDKQLLERSIGLLKRFRFEGAAMIEYKLDERRNVPFLMEINGRLWGSLQLAIDAGVDFPALLVAAALGDKRPPVITYREGVRSRWFWGDVDHLLLRWRSPAAGPQSGNRMEALVDFLSALRPAVKGEVFRFNDPLPAVRETLDWLKALGAN